MIDVFLKHSYIYWGDDLEITYYDTTKPSTEITFKTYPKGFDTAYDTFTVTTDSTGYLTTTQGVDRTTYQEKMGVYTLRATGGSEERSVQFMIDYRGVLINRGLDTLLQGFQAVPVYDEPAIIRTENSNTYATYTYAPWKEGITHLTFRKNDSDLTLFTDVFPDYVNGRALIKGAYVTGDDYFGSYQFKFFEESEWGNYLQLSLDELNGLKPVTSYNFNGAPNYYDPALVMGAYRKSLQRLLLSMEFWNSRLVFPEPTGLRGTLTSLLTGATAEFMELRKSAKRRGLVSPVGITSYKATIPRLIDNINMRMYTLASLSVPSQY